MSQNQEYVEEGKVSEIINEQMKYVEINGKTAKRKNYSFCELTKHAAA